MFGVAIGPPYELIAEKPTSSSTMYTTLGAPSGALGGSNGAQSGSESRISTLIVPLNSEPINPTALSSRMPEPFQADTRTSRFEDGNALGRLASGSRRLADLHEP